MAQIARGYLKLHLKKVFFKILNIFLFFLFYMLMSIYFIIIFFFFGKSCYQGSLHSSCLPSDETENETGSGIYKEKKLFSSSQVNKDDKLFSLRTRIK
jgi:hypothetical protein